MKFKLNTSKGSIEIDISKVNRISGISQSNLIIVMKTGEVYNGYMLEAI